MARSGRPSRGKPFNEFLPDDAPTAAARLFDDTGHEAHFRGCAPVVRQRAGLSPELRAYLRSSQKLASRLGLAVVEGSARQAITALDRSLQARR